MGRYWRCGLAAAAVMFSAPGVWAQSITGCPDGQVMQSSDPSGKKITCVAIPDTASLQQQIVNEANVRQQADTALGGRIDDLSARVDAITEADIVGTWAVTGSTNCLQSTNNFTANMTPASPTFVSQLQATFIGTRTFHAGGTGHSVGTTHALSFPGIFIGIPPETSTGGASVATLDEDFEWQIDANGTLLVDDGGTAAQPFIAPPSRIGFTATIEGLPTYVGYISKDRKTIVMTHPGMSVEISTVRNVNTNVVQSRTPRFCTRHRVLTRLAD